MKQIPLFTKRETPVHNMKVFFQWVSMDLESDPNLSFATRLSFNTLDSVVFHILPMQYYTVIETTEVVSLSPLTFMVP